MLLRTAVASGAATGRTLGVFTRYGELGASSRLRILPYLPLVSTLFDSVGVNRLLDDTYLQQLYYQNRRNSSRVCMSYLRRGMDTVKNRGFAWIEKELFPFLPEWIERLLISRSSTVVLDYDDAIFHNYDMNKSHIVRALLRRKIDMLMARATLLLWVTGTSLSAPNLPGARGSKWFPLSLISNAIGPPKDLTLVEEHRSLAGLVLQDPNVTSGIFRRRYPSCLIAGSCKFSSSAPRDKLPGTKMSR